MLLQNCIAMNYEYYVTHYVGFVHDVTYGHDVMLLFKSVLTVMIFVILYITKTTNTKTKVWIAWIKKEE